MRSAKKSAGQRTPFEKFVLSLNHWRSNIRPEGYLEKHCLTVRSVVRVNNDVLRVVKVIFFRDHFFMICEMKAKRKTPRYCVVTQHGRIMTSPPLYDFCKFLTISEDRTDSSNNMVEWIVIATLREEEIKSRKVAINFRCLVKGVRGPSAHGCTIYYYSNPEDAIPSTVICDNPRVSPSFWGQRVIEIPIRRRDQVGLWVARRDVGRDLVGMVLMGQQLYFVTFDKKFTFSGAKRLRKNPP